MILTVLASLLPLASIACGGSTGEVDPVTGEPAPSASSSSSSQGDAGPGTSSNSNNNNNNGSSTSDGGTASTSDAGSTTTAVSANCNVTATSPQLCVDDVHGTAGSIIDLPIEFIGTAQCTDALEASGHLQMSQYFLLTNAVEQVDCITNELYAAPPPDEIEVMWDHFGAGSISACPNHVQAGRLDTLKIEILPGTPSGDYEVAWNGAGLANSTVGCDMVNLPINGHIHVD